MKHDQMALLKREVRELCGAEHYHNTLFYVTPAEILTIKDDKTRE